MGRAADRGAVSATRGRCWVTVLGARPGHSEGEQAVIHRLASARKAPRDVVQRCRVAALSWDGWLVSQIADELKCCQKTVRRRLHRFNRWGLESLGDLGGQGRKRRINGAERSRTVGLVKQTPPGRLEGAAVERDVGRGRVRALRVDLGRAGRRGPGPGHRRQPLPGAPNSARGRGPLAAHTILDAFEGSGLRGERTPIVELYISPPVGGLPPHLLETLQEGPFMIGASPRTLQRRRRLSTPMRVARSAAPAGSSA
ncbi:MULTISPECIES: helix-turn-helix domain-containing protein [unclassified Streptomyces]|uniref:helix-turn-helix domain-containing protein n=1 Tax=Streptomyces TaxID=1883 RepID=UPI001EEFD140|nr:MULTISPECIES: helix-turn-helix domain-containing protein [unclassified Streptomyces]